MLKNIKIVDLKNTLSRNFDMSEDESLSRAQHLVTDLDEIFEDTLKNWIETDTILNVRFKNVELFNLMHYMDMNYIEAIEILNLYISDNNLECIKICKRLKRKDWFWKTLAGIFGS